MTEACKHKVNNPKEKKGKIKIWLFRWFFIVIAAAVIIFLIPRLEWLGNYRFIIQLMLFLFGSFFLLIQIIRFVWKQNSDERSLAAFSSLLRSTPNYMVITDSYNRVRFISEPLAKFAYFSSQELAVTKPLLDLFSDKKLKLLFADILDAEGFMETVMPIEINGEERYFKVVADKLAGDIDGMFIDISDITQMVNSKKAAEEAQIRAESASASKSRFLATMSHEIRTPMNAIIGITEIELENAKHSKETQASLRRIYNSAYTLLNIINDILDLSKIETGKLEIIPVKYGIANLINDTVQLNIMRIGSKNIKFTLYVSEDLPQHLTGDDLRIKQILSNLLSNAFKYTEEGTVTMDIKPETAADEETVNLVITVSDTGQGMSEGQVEKLFEEYSRFNLETNRMVEGTGLGMHITKKLVDRMQGSITVESELGKGSVFTVKILQKIADSGKIGRELAKNLENFGLFGEKQAKKELFSRKYMPYGSVLVVDDIETNLYVAQGLLKPYGLKVDTAISGIDAINKIKAGNTYDVIFMDHMMPEMDGIEATAAIRAWEQEKSGAGEQPPSAGIPIVALTANAIVGNMEMFMSSGFDDYISKPIDIIQLDRALNKWIHDRQNRETLQQDLKDGKIEKFPLPGSADNIADTIADAIIDNSTGSAILIIPGVDTAKGIALTGGTETSYKSVLSHFCKDAEKRLPELQTIPYNISVLVTMVHALKSASASIGAAEVSLQAARLEEAGMAGDTAFIKENLGSFTRQLSELLKNIKTALENREQGTESKEQGVGSNSLSSILIQQLNELAAAIKSRSASGIDNILEELNKKTLDSETGKILEQISDQILMAEYDKALVILEENLKRKNSQ